MTTYIKIKCQCNNRKCRRIFTAWWPKDDESNPPCPICNPEKPWEPKPFAIGNAARQRAVKLAMGVAEQQGFSDMKDNLRPGETGVKLTPAQSKMADAADAATVAFNNPGALTPSQSSAIKSFWGGGRFGHGVNSVPVQTVINNAQRGAAVSKAEGFNPLTMLQSGIKSSREKRYGKA